MERFAKIITAFSRYPGFDRVWQGSKHATDCTEFKTKAFILNFSSEHLFPFFILWNFMFLLNFMLVCRLTTAVSVKHFFSSSRCTVSWSIFSPRHIHSIKNKYKTLSWLNQEVRNVTFERSFLKFISLSPLMLFRLLHFHNSVGLCNSMFSYFQIFFIKTLCKQKQLT